MRLEKSLQAWDTPDFAAVFKQELAQQASELPLQQGLAASSSVAESPLTVLLHSASATPRMLCVKAGIFYEGVVGGCSCTDDPTPDSALTEYCELLLEIDRASAATTVTLLEE
jgi:hypothetical protein